MEEMVEWIELLTGCSPLSLMVDSIAHWRERAMTDQAYVVHQIPGRVRVRVPKRRDDLEFFRNVEGRLYECPSVLRVHCNPQTASLLILYKGELPELLQDAAKAGLASLVKIEMELPPIKPITENLRDHLVRVNQLILRSTGGRIDGYSAVIASFLLTGLLQVVRGQVLGPAVPLLWYAIQALDLAGPSERR